MADVPTVTVKVKSHGGFAVINEADFKGELHEKVDASVLKQAKTAGPTRAYRVFKSFSFQGTTYEQGQDYDFTAPVASVVSEKFGCIWPVDTLKELENRPDNVRALQEGTGKTTLTGDEDMETLKTHLAVAQGDLESSKKALSIADGNLGRVTDERDRAVKERDALAEKVKALEADKAKLAQDLKKTSGQLAESRGEVTSLEKQVKDLTKQVKEPQGRAS